jgi:hypothetical protein
MGRHAAPPTADPEDELEICVTMTDGDIIEATHMNPFENPFDSVQGASLVEDTSVAPLTADPEDKLQICVTMTDENLNKGNPHGPI